MSTAVSNPPNRKIILLLVFLTLAPVILSTLAYFFWHPTGVQSYGELLPTRPVPTMEMTTLDGKPAPLAELKGKWLLVVVDNAACDAQCAAALHAIRQYRVSQNTEMDRLDRVWLVADGKAPTPEAVKAAEGAQIRLVHGTVPLPGAMQQSFYLIDPLGNQVMRYGRDATPSKVIKELGRVLKNNQSLG
ncbi:MAG: hypothetical protein JO142_12160 [Burkholderiales bacterium]|nr:hypothetical protein [Burkholderiales bacterium]